MKTVSQSIEIPQFDGFRCVGHGLPKKGQYFIDGSMSLIQVAVEFDRIQVLIYEKIDIADEVTYDAVSKIPKFPGYVFDRIGTPKVNEYILMYNGAIELVSSSCRKDSNYVIYRKETDPVTLTFSPLSNFVGRKLKENEVLIVHNNSISTFNPYFPSLWNNMTSFTTKDRYGCLITFKKETE